MTSLASLTLLEEEGEEEEMENEQVPKMEVIIDSDASTHDLSSEEMEILNALLPRTIFVNHRLADNSLSLTQQVCTAASDNTTPLPCGNVTVIRPERFSPTSLELKIYLHANCKSNIAALDELFTWFSQYPE